MLMLCYMMKLLRNENYVLLYSSLHLIQGTTGVLVQMHNLYFPMFVASVIIHIKVSVPYRIFPSQHIVLILQFNYNHTNMY
jgi:hypothetical protein